MDDLRLIWSTMTPKEKPFPTRFHVEGAEDAHNLQRQEIEANELELECITEVGRGDLEPDDYD